MRLRVPVKAPASFHFDDDWWSRIEPTLPSGLSVPRFDRRFLERYFQRFRALPERPQQLAKQWRDLEKLARAMLRKLQKIEAPDTQKWFGALLEKIAADASEAADAAQLLMLPTVRKQPHKGQPRIQGTRRPNLELLYRDLMLFWTSHGGDLAFSRNVVDGKLQPTGPLIDFLRAVLSGLSPTLSGEGLASAVDRERVRRKRPSIQ